MKKFLEIFENVFGVVGLLFFSGALLGVFGSPDDGPNSSLLSPTAITAIRYLIWGTSFLLLCGRWRSAFHTARSNVSFWLLLAMIVISPLWSDDRSFTIPAVREVLQMSTFGWYLASRFSIKQQMRMVGLALMIGGLLSTVMALGVPRIGQHNLEHIGAWRGVYIHKNELGSRMVMAAVISMLYALGQPAKRVAWLGFGGAWLLILLCQSRGLIGIGLLTVAITYWCLKFRWRGHGSILLMDSILLLGGGAIATIVFNWFTIASEIGKTPDASGRFPLWGSVLSSLQERPWFGFGRSGFWSPNSPYAALAGQAVTNRWLPPNAHNGFLDVALDVGIVGLILFLITFAIALSRSYRLAYATREPAFIWAFVFLVFLVATNLTETLLLNLANMYWTLFVATSLSLRDALAARAIAPKKIEAPPELIS